MPTEEQTWDDRYEARPGLWSGEPNIHLVEEVGALHPGAALDLGCGEGGDAIWLAASGWTVTAVDISSVALARAAVQARRSGAGVAARIEWVHANLADWEPPASRFDLVSAQYVHLTDPPRHVVLGRMAKAVAPGGTLLFVGHHLSDMQTSVPRPGDPGLYFSGGEIVALLGADTWEVVRNDVPQRQVADPSGAPAVVRAVVVRARRAS